MHQAGLRLQRLDRPAQGRGIHRARHLAGQPEKLAKFRERDGLTITLLSDVDKDVLTAWGAFGEKKLYGKVVQGVIRSTFVVDPEGTIEYAAYNVKATGHVAKLRKDLGLETA